MTDPTNADRALAQSADQELAQLLASAHLNWICGREVTKKNAGEMLCVRVTRADKDRIIDALTSREAAGYRRGLEKMRGEPTSRTASEEEAWRKVILLATCESLSLEGYKNVLAEIRIIAFAARAASAVVEAAGYRRGQEEMRERAACIAATYRGLSRAIRALPITGAGNTRVGLPPFAAVVSFFETTESGETTAMKLGDDDCGDENALD